MTDKFLGDPSVSASPATGARTQRNCQQEPHYPDHETVAMSLRYPMMTCHYPTERCAIQEPHQTAECGEFAALPDTPLGAPSSAGGETQSLENSSNVLDERAPSAVRASATLSGIEGER